MAESSRKTHYSYADYLALEDESLTRHEYFDGEIYAMAGGTPEHAALISATFSAVLRHLPGSCRIFTSDLRLRTPTGLTTYPDLSVVCRGIQRAADDHLAATNPTLLVEVTSESTEEYDRGVKLRHYQSFPSLKEILFVSHREHRLSLHRRDREGRWISFEAMTGESITLELTGEAIHVNDLYRDARSSLLPPS
jgi:Uma2 family endonuclease